MFNEERKQEFLRYIRSIGQSNLGFITLFKKTEQYESLYQKDLCDFVYAEIDKLFSALAASSTGALTKNISYLRTYTDWCCSYSLSIDNINHYDEINTSIDNLKKYLNKESSICPTREKILEDLLAMKNYSDKFLILALFEGVRTEDVGELLRAKISKLEGNVLTFENGEKRVLSNTLVKFAEYSATEEMYVSISGSTTRLAMGGNIINSRMNTSKNSMESLNRRIKDRLGVLRRGCSIPYLTVPRLNTAGAVCELKNIIQKYDISPSEVFDKKYLAMVNPNYQLEHMNRTVMKHKFYCYL